MAVKRRRSPWAPGAAAARRPHAVATPAATAARALSRRKRPPAPRASERRAVGNLGRVNHRSGWASSVRETKHSSHWQDTNPRRPKKSGPTLVSVRHSPTGGGRCCVGHGPWWDGNHSLLGRSRPALPGMISVRATAVVRAASLRDPQTGSDCQSGSRTIKVRAPHGSDLSGCANATPAAWYSRKSGLASSSVIDADRSCSRSRSAGSTPGVSRWRRLSRAPSRNTWT